jgi:hypothetical protein
MIESTRRLYRSLLFTETYETYFGKAEVKRYVYQSPAGGKTYCPLDEKAQLIEGATPK